MQEIQGVADATVFKFILIGVASVLGLINALVLLILKDIKKSIDDLWSKRNIDHDKLIRLEQEHKIFHKNDTSIDD
jgi:hypothetical protein